MSTYKSNPFTDNIIALRLLAMLTTPFNKTEAYKQGVIDEKGNYLIEPSKRTFEQKQTVTYLDRFVWNIKKMLNKLPGGENQTKNLLAAMILIKESYYRGNYNILNENYVEKVNTSPKYQTERDRFIQIWTDYIKKERVGVGAIGGGTFSSSVPNNTTSGIDIYDKPLGFSRRKKNINLL